MQEFLTRASQFVYDGFLYDVFFVAGFVAVFLFYLWRGKYFNVSPIKSVLLVLIVYPSVVLWMFILYWIEAGEFGGNNIVRVFVYMPLFALPAAKLLKLTWKQACDLLAPAACVVHAVSHWGCIFAGCCAGYPSSWGIYNVETGNVCFPSQPLEALTALVIILILLWREKKNDYQVDGLSMPIMLMLFGFTRFFWEFFRDNEKLWMGCSSLAFHALFMGIVGLMMYVVIRIHNRRQAEKQAQKKIEYLIISYQGQRRKSLCLFLFVFCNYLVKLLNHYLQSDKILYKYAIMREVHAGVRNSLLFII